MKAEPPPKGRGGEHTRPIVSPSIAACALTAAPCTILVMLVLPGHSGQRPSALVFMFSKQNEETAVLLLLLMYDAGK